MKVRKTEIGELILDYTERYNKADFIETDPISIPHSLAKRQDKEMMGLIAAILAWGNRKSTIKSCQHLIQLLGGSPLEFLANARNSDWKPLEKFVHRTFNGTDLISLLDFFREHYANSESLVTAFLPVTDTEEITVRSRLIGFHDRVFANPDYPSRTRKHVATPVRGSACKRLNLFLKWMVRKDDAGVDLGLWADEITSRDLICPIDVHVHNTALKLCLITDKQKVNWKTAESLTEQLRIICPDDPVRLDYGLFGLSHVKLIDRIEVIT